MINIVIPMAGQGSRFSQVGYLKPKPFIDVNGIPMIERVINNLIIPDAKFILIARREHLKAEPELVKYLENKYDVTFIAIDKLTEGTACTVLYARTLINNTDPLLIANSDQIIDFDINLFINDCQNRNLDGSILCFKEPTLDLKWSYAKLDKNNLVINVKEKVAISENATVGIYLFSKGKYFVDNTIDMIVNNDRVNNEFYTCPVYNYAINAGLKIGIYNIEKIKMHGIGTPEDLSLYLEKFI
jgi:NDP-sugar pyrophosphorylase family protein